MATGKLHIQFTDLRGTALNAKVELDFQRMSGDLGVGGEGLEARIPMGSSTDAIISKVSCRGGPGTMYRLSATAPHYRDYSFFQLIMEDTVNPASDDVEFWVKPGDVKDIRVPDFSDLPVTVQSILNNAQTTTEKPEDRDLVGLSGKNLYENLGPLRKACLLNIVKKASHRSTDSCLPHIQGLLLARQDRFFAFVDAGLEDSVNLSTTFKSAGNSLHTPPAGFSMRRSFKSRDAHANIQLTFMMENASGRLAADIDIDESSGIEHGLEVIRNATFRSRTNPYLIREFLLSADPVEHSLDPGYDFVF